MARSDTIQVEGQPMRVYLDVPAGGGAVPGVVVIMHGPGLDPLHRGPGGGPRPRADAWEKMHGFLDKHLKRRPA